MREATALFFLVFTAKAQLKDCFTWDQQLSRDYPCDPEAAVRLVQFSLLFVPTNLENDR